MINYDHFITNFSPNEKIIIDVAYELFGTPNDSFHWGECHGQGQSYEINWAFDDYNLKIIVKRTSHPARQYEIEILYCPRLSDNFYSSSVEKLKKLVSDPSLSDWSESEIIIHPMWICIFQESNGIVSDSLRNAMVMFSYENPNSNWVKRYFQWQQNQKLNYLLTQLSE